MTTRRMPDVDFDQAPFLAIWETTQACELACQHCRASAQPNRDRGELTTDEGKQLITAVAEMGTPVFILSGGDPLKRPDLCELISWGKQAGLRMGTIPAATPTLNRNDIERLKDAGLDQMAMSLDFPRADLHDDFRCAPGAFRKTMQALEWAHDVQMPVQINTSVFAGSAAYLPEMAELVKTLGIVFWEVFFLVPVGRGENVDGLTAQRCEELFDVLYRAQKEGPFIVKVTEAPHYRRFVAQRELAESDTAPLGPGHTASMPRQLLRSEGPGHTVGLAARGVNAGKGFAFVSHLGEVFPSGFFPCSAGNVRTDGIEHIYRDSPLFRSLREPDRLDGRCGRCEFRTICGGSRSRAFALTNDYFATDPWCAYQPVADAGVDEDEPDTRSAVTGSAPPSTPTRVP
ncbi:MAG: TIGR04053 family radical SAM/SPASM domain-containing protein [Vicinamibacterales bacterium]|nr:TIGR04053 family radical SAM/SPASM domain-containing protein [Vicinamibacterales bacterium]MDP7480551.1 TIGR04053 family radical SAM/SPASM domain-containing protein [Vicinamibacterales bacterium]MDP7692490.1 TIGR04053 family radical SAM/SPASM domain-containing protein [Vicinamibacterales bacterium]HJN44284.1 TIGR04053 family radical SAM/SPASM domain-containing protein [Vicinamibacterales bacterium]